MVQVQCQIANYIKNWTSISMFDHCSLINKRCPFAGKEKGITYCGLHTGLQIQNSIKYITSCPKKKFKRR